MGLRDPRQFPKSRFFDLPAYGAAIAETRNPHRKP